jgi:hypothetical protein
MFVRYYNNIYSIFIVIIFIFIFINFIIFIYKIDKSFL